MISAKIIDKNGWKYRNQMYEINNLFTYFVELI